METSGALSTYGNVTHAHVTREDTTDQCPDRPVITPSVADFLSPDRAVLARPDAAPGSSAPISGNMR
jgi:hypothetical protein